jgi:hypothetical protein
MDSSNDEGTTPPNLGETTLPPPPPSTHTGENLFPPTLPLTSLPQRPQHSFYAPPPSHHTTHPSSKSHHHDPSPSSHSADTGHKLPPPTATATAFSDGDDEEETPFTQVSHQRTRRGGQSFRGPSSRASHGHPSQHSNGASFSDPLHLPLQAPSHGPSASATSRPNPRVTLQQPSLAISALQASGFFNDALPSLPVDPSPILQSLQNLNVLPQNFLFESMIVTIKLPPKEPSAPKRIIIMDVTPLFFNAIIEALKTSAQSSIISKSWSLALIVGIGPTPPPSNDEDVTQYMFQIIFRWSPSSSITLDQVQNIISLSSSCTESRVHIITRSRRSDQPHTTFVDTPLNCLAVFSKNMTEAIPRSIKTKSPSLSYQFTLTLHDNCPDNRIAQILTEISTTILGRSISTLTDVKTFQRVSQIHSNYTAAPRITNNWRHVATFHREPSEDCPRLFNSLLALHKLHRSKLLFPTDHPPSKVKNATFSFFNEMKQSKIKTNTNLIDWMVKTFDSFTSHNPLSLQTDTETDGGSAIELRRNPQNPWQAPRPNPLPNLVLPGFAPLFENYNEFLHKLQAEKRTHLATPRIVTPPSLTSLSSIETSSISISFTTTVEDIPYTVQGPMLFTRHDFGQFTTIDGRKWNNACLLLCLASATQLDPTLLAHYFTARKRMLCEADTLYQQHQTLRDHWASFCFLSEYSHFGSCFPRSLTEQEWAGSFTLGKTIDFNHICALAPLEICNCSILFITDNSLPDNHNRSDIFIELSTAPNKISYFPPTTTDEDTPLTFIIILHRDSHYTLLTPSTLHDNVLPHNYTDEILAFLTLNHQIHIPAAYSSNTPPIARLVGLAYPCSDTTEMETAHRLMLKDIRDNFDRSLPREGDHDCFPIVIDDTPPPAPIPATEIPTPASSASKPNIPFTPSPLPGSKHGRVIDAPDSAEAAHTAPRPRDSGESPPTLNAMSLSSSSPPAQAEHHAPFPLHDAHGVDCDLYVEPPQNDPISSSPPSPASSEPSSAEPPPWPIDRIIRCASVALNERLRPDSPTNARNLRYLVHRPHLCNIWTSYNVVRTTEACDLFILANPEITGHVFTNAPPPASDTATDSNSSSLDLGDLVTAATPANETAFQFQLGVRGQVSSDTSSETGSYSASGIGSQFSSSIAPSINSTGSFHPHLMSTTAYPRFRPPPCTNPTCASMSFGCFHQDNHTCDFDNCRRRIQYAEFGWHCPHCDRDYCITCRPVPWTPVSSVLSNTPSSQHPGTQELLLDNPPTTPVASHSQASSEV